MRKYLRLVIIVVATWCALFVAAFCALAATAVLWRFIGTLDFVHGRLLPPPQWITVLALSAKAAGGLCALIVFLFPFVSARSLMKRWLGSHPFDRLDAKHPLAVASSHVAKQLTATPPSVYLFRTQESDALRACILGGVWGSAVAIPDSAVLRGDCVREVLCPHIAAIVEGHALAEGLWWHCQVCMIDVVRALDNAVRAIVKLASEHPLAYATALLCVSPLVLVSAALAMGVRCARTLRRVLDRTAAASIVDASHRRAAALTIVTPPVAH